MEVDYKKLVLFEHPRWIWQLHNNQSYLGRTLLILKREILSSWVHSRISEQKDLVLHCKEIEDFLVSLFTPDRFNYGQLGNIYPVVHFHIVPRYEEPRIWINPISDKKHKFVDKNWGRNWAPTPKSPISIEETYQFRDWLASEYLKFRESSLSAPKISR